jgi:plastocyanin
MRYLLLSVLVVCMIGIMIPSAFAETYNVSNAPGSSTPGCENTNSCFIPSVLNIQVGDSVIWTNDDTTVHTITSGTSSGGTDGAFDSSLVQPGSSYTLTFPGVDTYNYFCVVHPWMEGIVTVTSSTPTPPTINVSTDKSSYQSGDTIIISGTITNPIEGKDVVIKSIAPSGNIVDVRQIVVSNPAYTDEEKRPEFDTTI